MKKSRRQPFRRRPRFEQLEARQLLSTSQLACTLDDDAMRAEGEATASRWHNAALPADVDDNGLVTPRDVLLIANDLNRSGARQLPTAEAEAADGSPRYLDVNRDGFVTPLDALQVVNALQPEGEFDAGVVVTAAEVKTFLRRAAAASASEDAVIAIVDRGGRILGVRVEKGVIMALDSTANTTSMGNGNGMIDPGTAEERTLVFAIDGAVAKARTAAFFANGDGSGVVGPLTSRTIRFVSQSTVSQREVESNPNITDPDSTERGPGFVAPIGLGGHFPPDIAHTPPVDLFAIEHTNRDSVQHAGLDAIIGTADDDDADGKPGIDGIDLVTRFGASYLPGVTIEAPESYGFASQRFPLARPRGIATLPGGIPLYRAHPKTGAPTLVGGIGVFFPGSDGYATFEQRFVPGIGQTTLARTNAPQVLEAEWIAFAAACGSRGAQARVGTLGGEACPAGYDLPFGRIDLVGITLEVYGPHPTRARPQSGIATLLAQRGPAGDPDSGADQFVDPGGDTLPGTIDDVFYLEGVTVPDEWLVGPLSSPEITADQVRSIISAAIAEADRVRAGIRLPIGSRTRMVFSVSDLEGNVLGLYRMPDATVFSLDVAVAKARNTAYYADATAIVMADRVDDDGDATPDPNVPAGTAFTNRTFRFLSEPRYPSGVENSRPGAFSILLDPGIDPATAENTGPALPASCYSDSQPAACFTSDGKPDAQTKIGTSVLGFDAFNPGRNFRDPASPENQNGIVFFPGSAPLYNDQGELIGGFGASGDGVDQDDVVTAAATVGFNPPNSIRADQFFVRNVRLPYQKFLRHPRG